MSATDDLLRNAEAYAESFDKGDLPIPPGRKVAVVACMDARLNPYGLLGLEEGDAHLIRNAGGVITDAEIRSLAISQELLGTREIVVIHHTDCGMLTFTDDVIRERLATSLGEEAGTLAAGMDFLPFPDVEESVRKDLAALKSSPLIRPDTPITGFVYDVATGRLNPVD